MSYDIALKRIYQPSDEQDGARVLVDRLWPRGKPRESLALTDWYRDASPSPALRRLYHEQEISFGVFASRYRGELRDDPDSLSPLLKLARQGRLTLLSAARDLEASHLPILKDALLSILHGEGLDDGEATPAASQRDEAPEPST